MQGPLDSDGAMHPVNFSVTDLAPGTAYHYRVVAINFAGASEGPDLTFTTPGPPQVGPINVSRVSARSAHVEATINPVLAATTFRVQYGTARSTREIPLGGADNAPHAASTDLAGLSPTTAYRIRVVATNANGQDVGNEQIFITPERAVATEASGQNARRAK